MSLEHRIVTGTMARVGAVERVYVGRRWVGMLHRDPSTSAGLPPTWTAQHRGVHTVASRDEALAAILRHAEERPDFDLG